MLVNNLYKILKKVKGKKYYLLIYRFIKLFLNICYPVYCRIVKPPVIESYRNDVIVSLTSFPARINSVWLTIESLIRQTYKPYKILLWLANSQFYSEKDLPRKLLNLKKRGLIIMFCDDLKSHKKYFYAMQEFPDHSIITVDDDTFYPENLIKDLVIASDNNPGIVCCNLAHVMTTTNGEIDKYEVWLSGDNGYTEPSDYIVPIGCEGVLYPPHTLSKEAFNVEKIKNICPLADDLWLKSMSALNGIKAMKINKSSITFANQISSKIQSLNSINVNQYMNDTQLKNIITNYPELKSLWK